jgi:hypothetical protein
MQCVLCVTMCHWGSSSQPFIILEFLLPQYDGTRIFRNVRSCSGKDIDSNPRIVNHSSTFGFHKGREYFEKLLAPPEGRWWAQIAQKL